MENTKGRKIKSIDPKTNKEIIYNSVIEAARSLGNLNTRRDIYINVQMVRIKQPMDLNGNGSNN